MLVRVVLVDINPKMVRAWHSTFEENPEVEIIEGSMLEMTTDAWVTPTNSRGRMDGGLDAVIKNFLGAQIETRVQAEIRRRFGGVLPVGHAIATPTGVDHPKFLISTPTMFSSSEDISDTMNVALACAAAFQAVHMQNNEQPRSITSVALPGLGANTGKVPVEICADLMWTGYNLFREEKFNDYLAMRQGLESQLGELGPSTASVIKQTPGSPGPPSSQPNAKKQDIDFDDFDEDEDLDDFDENEEDF